MSISIDELERVAADGWRAPEQVALGGWLLRAADGFTGRANSALAAGDPGLPLPLAVDHVREWYRARGLPALIATAFPLGRPEHNPVDAYLAERGWPVHHGAIVMTAAAGAVEPSPIDPPPVESAPAGRLRVEVIGEPSEGWLSRYRYRGAVPPLISRQLLLSAPWQAFAAAEVADETVAIGRVAAAGGWAGLTAIEVHPVHRRRGLGRLITAALANAARGRAGHGIYLQVEDDNAPARALYESLGFTGHHGYHYRAEPAS